MKRLFRSGISLGVAFLVALFLGGPVLAADAPGATPAAPAAAPAAQGKPAAAPMMNKPMMAKRQHEAMSLEMRKRIQTALNSHGANLKVDGRLGKQSREAIRKFQSENGLKATGWPGKATLEKLGVK